MELTNENMLQFLDELNLSEMEKTKCKNLWIEGKYVDLYRYLRILRIDFLDDLHESQQRLDQLDYLIYNMKKRL